MILPMMQGDTHFARQVTFSKGAEENQETYSLACIDPTLVNTPSHLNLGQSQSSFAQGPLRQRKLRLTRGRRRSEPPSHLLSHRQEPG